MSGENHPNWNLDHYRNICFKHHEYRCVVCEHNLIVEVHHLDGDNTNNHPSNLIPLCPTHHKCWHSHTHRKEVDEKVFQYQQDFINGLIAEPEFSYKHVRKRVPK